MQNANIFKANHIYGWLPNSKRVHQVCILRRPSVPRVWTMDGVEDAPSISLTKV